MPFTQWTGKAKNAKKRSGGISPLSPKDLAFNLKETGWTEVVLTVSGKEVTP